MRGAAAIFELAERVAEKGKYEVWFGYNGSSRKFGIGIYTKDDCPMMSLRHVSINDTRAMHMIRSKLEAFLEEK